MIYSLALKQKCHNLPQSLINIWIKFENFILCTYIIALFHRKNYSSSVLLLRPVHLLEGKTPGKCVYQTIANYSKLYFPNARNGSYASSMSLNYTFWFLTQIILLLPVPCEKLTALLSHPRQGISLFDLLEVPGSLTGAKLNSIWS